MSAVGVSHRGRDDFARRILECEVGDVDSTGLDRLVECGGYGGRDGHAGSFAAGVCSHGRHGGVS